MHRRSLIPLAAGVVTLLAFAPVLGSQPSLWAAENSGKATTTTAAADDSAPADDSASSDGTAPADDSAGSGSGSGKSSSSTTATTRKGSTPTTASTAPGSGAGTGASANCAPPETDRAPAPQVGDAPSNHEASDAGEVQVERVSDTELRIAKVTPKDGWTHTVTAPSGPRVNVRFNRSGQSPSIIRFAASMDQAGQELHIRITSCG